jgi:double-GTPase-like protein
MVRSYETTTLATIPCVICGTENSMDAAICSECSAPMAIGHDLLAGDRNPQIVSIVGESNVGKTVYLGFLLDMLSQRAGDFEAIPKGPYSIDLQETVISHMANRRFPPKTPMEANEWYWAYYQIHRQSQPKNIIDLIMPDMAGESLAAEIATPETFGIIRNLVTKSAGTMLLIDAGLSANGSSRPDFFALKMMSYLDSMQLSKPGERIQTPIAVVLCKSDYCPECFENPRRFAKANLNRLWNMCESRFENVDFFACSVVGSLGFATKPDDEYVIPIPLHTALQGILEPFEWIIDQF